MNSNNETIISHVANINAMQSTSNKAQISLYNNTVQFDVDSGADANIITENAYHKLHPKPPLVHSSMSLWPYGAKQPLHNLGKFSCMAKVGQQTTKDDFHVVRNDGKGGCLLSRDTFKKLGLLILPHMVNAVVHDNSDKLEQLQKKYDDIFHGVGCHNALKVSLPVDKSVTPVASPPSRIPLNMRVAVKQELDRLESQGFIQPAPVDDNSQFISRMVPVPRKIEGSDKVGVRITIDWRNLNQGLSKCHHFQPTVEQMCYDLNGAKILAHLDMKDAFSQLPLDEESIKLTTFSTPWGLYHYLRLIQGAIPSSSIFHEAVRRLLEEIDHAVIIADNLLVWGCGDTI